MKTVRERRRQPVLTALRWQTAVIVVGGTLITSAVLSAFLVMIYTRQ